MSKQVYTLDDLRRWDEVGAELKPAAKLAVIGDPIAHSRSPQMHNPALKERGIDAQYIRVHVPVGSVKEALGLFAQHGFVGVNCTIPHKFEALEAVDVVDDLARELGAVNTVAIRDGRLFGYNSDGPGFLISAKEAFGVDLDDLCILILGAGGGAGHAVAVQCALKKCGGLLLANRSVDKLAPVLEQCSNIMPGKTIKSVPMDAESLAEALADVDVIVNATPMGMKEGDTPLFDFSKLRPRHYVYDMVYRADGTTPLIAAAEKAGALTCNGLQLLLHQGAVSFEHWFGAPVPLEAMRSGLSNPA